MNPHKIHNSRVRGHYTQASSSVQFPSFTICFSTSLPTCKALEGQRVTITSNNWYFKYVRNTMSAGRKPLATDKEAKFVFSDL